jgi:hypothetical protein
MKRLGDRISHSFAFDSYFLFRSTVKINKTMFTDANTRTQSRTTAIKPLMKRLRNATSSPVYDEVKLAYQSKPNSVALLRDIVENVSSSVPSSQEFSQAARRATKRTQLVELLVTMLESSGFDRSNRFQGGATASMAPSL